MAKLPLAKTRRDAASGKRPASQRSERPRTRDAQFESRCQRFVEVSQELFLERGFAGTSVNEIVRRAGGSLATLYAEFGTKDELFQAVMNQRATNMFTNIVHRKGGKADIASDLLALARRLQAHMLSDSALAVYRLAVHEGPKFPAVRRAVLDIGLKGFLQQLGGYFSELSAQGRLSIDDPLDAAELFLTLVQGQLRIVAACGDAGTLSPVRRRKHARRAVEVFLQVYPPTPAPRKKT